MHHRNLELDRLRAFAVLMTLYIHVQRMFYPWATTPEYQPSGQLGDLWSNCWTGVDLFLVISGFIISRLIVGEIDAARGEPLRLALYVKAFFVRRMFRIFPVAWTMVLFVLVASWTFNDSGAFGSTRNTVEAGVAIFTYSFNYFLADGHYHSIPLGTYWSLAVEEQFYLVFPFFLILTRSHRQRVLIMLGLLLLVTFVLRPLAVGDSHVLRTQNRCDGLLYGCLLYLMSAQPWFDAIRLRVRRRSGAAGLGVVALVLVLAALAGIGFGPAVVVPLACLLATLLVFIAACEANVIRFPAPLEGMLDYFGSRSYSLYIAHFPMFGLTREIMFRYCRASGQTLDAQWSLPYTLLGLGLSLLATEALYRLVELPWIARGRRAGVAASGGAQAIYSTT